MKVYRIGRAIDGVTINGLEYLLDAKGEPVEFNSRDECLKYCKKVGLDESFIQA